jgi:hypothetical protein
MNIRRRVPKHALGACLAVERFAEAQLNDLNDAQRTHALAFILSVWARESRASGAFQLSVFSYRRMQNAGERSAKLLSALARQRADEVLGELKKKGLI